MEPRRISYAIGVGGELLPAHRVVGREALSEPSQLDVSIVIPVASTLEPDAIAGSQCSLHILVDGLPVRSIRLVAMSAERGASALATAVGVPLDLVLASPLALSRYREDIRIFRDHDVPTIVTKVLAAFGIAVERRLSESYAVRAYTVQWRRERLRLRLARLLEDEGIYYETQDDGGLRLADAASAYEPGGAPLDFIPTSGFHAGGEAVTAIGWTGSMTASTVTMRDFDFKKPKLDVSGVATVSAKAAAGGGEWYAYPAARPDPGTAGAKAASTTEAFLAAQCRLCGMASRLTLAPNDRVALNLLPAGFSDGDYGVVVVHHDWTDERDGFSLRFEALSASTVFRPLPQTPRPSLVGAMVGNVTGAPGDDIHTDEWGRAKVHFHWDRLQPSDDKCSDWIPTLQDNTGHSIGIPRVGWEVLVQHLEGDADRPIILGRTYTPEDDFYSLLPENKMLVTLRSQTSPRSKTGTGENHIELLDLAKTEHMRFQAERDQVVLTEHDRTELTKQRDSREVGGHEKVVVGKSRHHDIAQSIGATVSGDQTTSIGHDRQVKIDGKLSETADKRSLTIGSLHSRRFGTFDELGAENIDEKIGALSLELCPENNQSTTDLAEVSLVGGALIELAKKSIAMAAKKSTRRDRRSASFSTGQQAAEPSREPEAYDDRRGNYTATAGKAMLFSGLKSLKLNVGELTLSATKKLTLKVKNTSLIMDGACNVIDAAENIVVHADARNDLNAAKANQNDHGGDS